MAKEKAYMSQEYTRDPEVSNDQRSIRISRQDYNTAKGRLSQEHLFDTESADAMLTQFYLKEGGVIRTEETIFDYTLTIIHESTDGLVKLAQTLRLPPPQSSPSHTVDIDTVLGLPRMGERRRPSRIPRGYTPK